MDFWKKMRNPLVVVSIIVTAIYILWNSSRVVVVRETPKANDRTFRLKFCDCERQNFDRPSAKEYQNGGVQFEETSCSVDSFRRGNGQKIVGFSFYGDVNSDRSLKKGYLDGVIENLELMPVHYPGWIMRLYVDLERNSSTRQLFCSLVCANPNLDICDVKDLPGITIKDANKMFPMNWRFLPTLDLQVDYFVSRDLDSRLNSREEAAVKEWLHSNKSFHFMRDHPQHGTTILGSGWGTCLLHPEVRQKWTESWSRAVTDLIMWKPRSDWGPDQTFLDRYIWPWAKSDSISHDSYLCDKYPSTLPFPTERKNEPNNFVASVVRENVSLWVECPEKCRPKHHLDWIHC